MLTLLPAVHPHASEPLVTDGGFSVELWTDWLVPAGSKTNYEIATSRLASGDRSAGRLRIQRRVTVDRSLLWLSVTVSGIGTVDDGVWACAEADFSALWQEVHELAGANARSHSRL